MRNGLRQIFMQGVGCILLVLPVAGLDEDYADRMLFADGLFARQMHDLAVREYTAIVAAFPEGEQNAAAMFRLAESLRLTGNAEAAGRYYGLVVSQFRESPYRLRAAYRRSRLYADAGDLQSAQAHFEAILTAGPEPDLDAATRYYLGEVLFQKGELKEADEVFRILQEMHPGSDFVVFGLLKRAEIRRQRLAAAQADQHVLDEALATEAITFYQAALSVAEADRLVAEILFQKADIRYRQEMFDAASALYRNLFERFPDDPRTYEARLQAAWSALRSNLYADALTMAQQALADGSHEGPVDEWFYIVANSQRQLLQTQQAAATYVALLERYPDSRFADAARYETAIAYYQVGDFEMAIRAVEPIRAREHLRMDVNWLLAESYAAVERPAEAVQHYRLVVGEAGTSERARDALYRLAHHLQQKGAFREASQFYLQLVDTFPAATEAPQALFASGHVLAQVDAHEDAVRDWRRLIQQYPEHALVEEALYQKAMGEIRIQRNQDAMASLVELLRLFSDSRYKADALYWQGMLHVEAGRDAAAESLLRGALQSARREEMQRDAQFQLGLVLQRLGQHEASAELLDALVTSPLRDRFAPALLEWLAAYHGEHAAYERMQQAAALLAVQADPAWQQSGYVLLARAYMGQGNMAVAEDALQKALALQVRTPYAGEAALRLGLLLLEAGSLEEAHDALRRVSLLAAGDQADAVRARSFVGLGRVALARQQPDEAARLFLSVGILYDDPVLVPESLYLAAAAFDEQAHSEEVAKVVSELLQRYPDSPWTEKARQVWVP